LYTATGTAYREAGIQSGFLRGFVAYTAAASLLENGRVYRGESRNSMPDGPHAKVSPT